MSRRAVALAAGVAKTAPFSLGAVLCLWVVGIATGTIFRGPTQAMLATANLGLPVFRLHGTWYPLGSRIWCADLRAYLITTFLFLGLCAPAERMLGTARTVKIYFFTLCGTTLVSAGIAFASVAAGGIVSPWLRTTSAAGPAVGVFGVVLAASHALSPLWRRRTQIVVLVTLVMLAVYSGQLQDFSRLAAALIGFLAGPLVLTGRSAAEVRRSYQEAIEPHERRLLVALVVAAVAAGPVVVAINRVANGPVGWLEGLWIAPPPKRAVVHQACRFAATHGSCHAVFGYSTTNGFGSEIRMMLPVLLAGVLAEGLRRGYRAAYLGALSFHLLLASTAALASLSQVLAIIGSGNHEPLREGYWTRDICASLIPLAIGALLYAMRKQFAVYAPPGTYRRLFRLSLGALGCSSALYLLGGYAFRNEFDRAFRFTDLLQNLPLRFLPPEYLGLVKPRFYPSGAGAGALSDWTGAAFWIIFLAALFMTFRHRSALEHHRRPETIREMLIEHGGSNLSYMSTWEGQDHWVSCDGRSAFAYRVVSSVAITTGGPLGEPTRRAAAIREFNDFCTGRGWTLCLFSISEDIVPVIEMLGWRTAKIADDAVVPLRSFDLAGRRLQDARTAMNRARREGVVAKWIEYPSALPGIDQQIAALARQRRAARRMPELSFTLGGVSELRDSGTRCLVAIDDHGVVHGVTSWIPVYRAGILVGWTLDFMRRSNDAFKGVMDYLIACACTAFKEEGFEFASLSGVPLPAEGSTAHPTVLEHGLRWIGSSLDKVFRFGSLLAFKDKFRPQYQSLFLAYRDGMDLPRIGYAIARAYVPQMSVREAIAFTRSMIVTKRGDPVRRRFGVMRGFERRVGLGDAAS